MAVDRERRLHVAFDKTKSNSIRHDMNELPRNIEGQGGGRLHQ